MKVLLTGGTGNIGSAILHHILQHPSITSVVALTRRPLARIDIDAKLQTIIICDWTTFDTDVLDIIADADAMIWCAGRSNANRAVNVQYPLAFQHAFAQLRTSEQRNGQTPKPFTYIHLSGALAEPDQSRSLIFLPEARKTKGLIENASMDIAAEYAEFWTTYILRPGGVSGFYCGDGLPALGPGGDSMFISKDELGAFVADLVTKGKEREESGVMLNKRMLERGKEILAAQKV